MRSIVPAGRVKRSSCSAKAAAVLVAAAFCACAQSRLTVKVDPRIELMAVVEILADYGWTGLLNTENTQYRRDVDAWFGPFRQHPAVQRFAALSKKGYTFDGPASTMVCLTAPPALALDGAAGACGADRAGGARSLGDWLAQLRDFAVKSRFPAFFEEHAGLYAQMEEATRRNLFHDYAADLEAYYGGRQASYNIVLAPLLVGNFGPRKANPDGTYDIYGVLGAGRSRDGIPQFGSVENLRYLVWHEFGHSFANPQVDRLKDQVAKSARLFAPIEARMRPLAYSNWHTAVIEHVVHAVTTRLAARELGADAGETALASERKNGFAYVPALVERLKEYEEHRDRYPDFASFAPRLIAVFGELAAAKLPADLYDVPLTLSEAIRSAKPVFIVPTGEADAAESKKISEFVRSVQTRLFPDAAVLTDIEALGRDLSQLAVLAYGTVAGNRWLERHREQIPALTVLADRKGEGPLRLIAAFPNPQNPKLGAVAYTGTDASVVTGINGVFHGPTSWVLARDRAVLATGDYLKRDGQWVVK